MSCACDFLVIMIPFSILYFFQRFMKCMCYFRGMHITSGCSGQIIFTDDENWSYILSSGAGKLEKYRDCQIFFKNKWHKAEIVAESTFKILFFSKSHGPVMNSSLSKKRKIGNHIFFVRASNL